MSEWRVPALLSGAHEACASRDLTSRPWRIFGSLALTTLAVGAVLISGPAAAQAGCSADVEPNDTAEQARELDGATCVAGSLPTGDQDLAIITIEGDDAATLWDFGVDGVPGTATLVQVFAITSDVGAAVPVVERTPLLELGTTPEGPATAESIGRLLPAGRYLVGIARSGLLDGSEPEEVGYTLRIEPGQPLPPSADGEPNEELEQAQSRADAFEASGDRQGNRSDFVAWDLSTAGERWDVSLQTPLGETAWLDVVDADGATIASTTGDTQVTIHDLALDPGRYGLKVRETGDQPSPYIVRAMPSAAAGDPEPNDDTADAVAIEDGRPIQGRLATKGDRDRYVLDVPAGEPVLRDVRMIWRSDAERTLCLLDEDDHPVVCRRATDGLNLAGLALSPGPHVLEVGGPEDPEDLYVMRVDTTSAVSSDFETEPNDELALADTLDPAVGMRGRGADGDTDVYLLQTNDAPQVWDVQVSGSGIRQLQLFRPSGEVLALGEIATDGSHARLADLHLIPGDHWLRVAADGPDYAITTTPLGPPDPDAEREPNDDLAQANRYRIGERAVGRLPTEPDRDVFRFTTAAPQRVRVDLQPPADADIRMRLRTRDAIVAELDAGEAGAPRSWDLWLEAGDHSLELIPESSSDGFYELTSERLDPYSGGIDQEPNDDESWARAVPASLTWTGDAAGERDTDWFLLPTTEADEPLAIHVDGAATRVRAQESVAGAERSQLVQLEREDEGTWTTSSPLTPGGRLRLAVDAEGPYEVSVEGAGWHAQPVAVPPPLELAWSLPVEAVAAYWPEAQSVDASVELTNAGSESVEVSIDGTTSHRSWSLLPPLEPLDVPAGASVTVPVPVLVGPDAWGTEPVLISVRATTDAGGAISASTFLGATAEAPPVASRPGWSTPEPLLGGLDMAALARGAEPLGTIDADMERRLFDEVTPAGPTGQADQEYGSGFTVFITDYVEGLPLDLVVDLAGDAPIPVAGTIVNPQASQGALREVPRDFELLLSTDGATWRSALHGTLQPLPLDQAFALEEPMPATHAMLRIHSKYVDQGGYVSLGEWKVITEPGFDPEPEGRDIANPAFGGHVVSFSPFDPDPEVAIAILDGETDRTAVEVGESLELELTVGFRDQRAALITELGWRDPQPSSVGERLDLVDVHASLDTPTGPWRFLGSWPLERAADGSVAAFKLEVPEWARFLQLRGRIPAGADEIELPAGISVQEHPTDDVYRSITGEWGYRSASGPYEASTPVEQGASSAPSSDAGDAFAEARELEPGAFVSGQVEIDSDTDWFSLEVPANHDTLEVVVDGEPFVGVALTLVDQSGTELEMPFRIAPDGSVRYQAEVEPGVRYGIEVEQPPFSVAFAFDTSPSIGPFLDQVTAGIRSFLSDVRRGREAATLLPFDEAPLLEDWSDDRYALQDAFENHVAAGSGSSSAESALIGASDLLAEREGARAILLVTDAETTSYERTPELWDVLSRVRPVVFAVHIGGVLEPIASRQRMQDWASSGSGHYSYPTTAGEMDQAFERMATWLRRPASYTLALQTRDSRPASLSVVAASDDGSLEALPLAPGVGVEIILDTSGSMRKRIGGKRRIQVAKAALRKLVNETIAEGTPVAIRTFGEPGRGREANCGTTQVLPLEPLRRATALTVVKGLGAGKKTGTPIAAALDAVLDDLAAAQGLRSVVLVTDGAASCDGDPRTSIQALRDAGVDVKLDVVGFALEDEALKAEMSEWAELGGGSYYDAANAGQLSRSVVSALSAPFRVSLVDGGEATTGTIGGPPLELEPGRYRLEILTDPPSFIDELDLASGETRTVTVPLELAPE